jgi:hypothetical protein
MKTPHRRSPRAPWSARHLAPALLAALALASCGGGGGGGGGDGSGGPTPPPPPTPLVEVHAVAPATGPFIGGTAVTLRGRAFELVTANEVLFGGQAATEIAVVDATTITCVTPPGTPGAAVDVVVRNARGTGTLAGGFLYAAPPPAQSDLSGDGIADLIVAAPGDATAAAGAGAVYVFFGRAGAFELDGLTAADADARIVGAAAGDRLGACVCGGDVDGDGVDDLVVGADRADLVGAPDAGAAYVFRGPIAPGSLLQAQAADVRLNGAPYAGDAFGSALELGDGDGDGIADLVVSAPGHDVPVPGGVPLQDSGCVYFFRGGPTLAHTSAPLADRAFDGALVGERLGEALSCGDLDGDGLIDLVLTAPLANVFDVVQLTAAGRVLVVFGRNGGADRAQLSGAAPGDAFGTAVVVADLDGDGVQDLAVGAPGNDVGDPEAGRVYVFRGGAAFADRRADQADFTFGGVPTQGSVGTTLRAGDVDGDAQADLLVGAPAADYLSSNNGRAYLFLGGPGLASLPVVEAHTVFAGAVEAGAAFSSSIALLDVDGDGFLDVAAGSPFLEGLGGLLLWRGRPAADLPALAPASAAAARLLGSTAGSRFGESIAPGI